MHETLTATPSARSSLSTNGSVVLHGVDWKLYDSLLEAFERSNSHAQLTYDRGTLEIMTLTSEHEIPKKLIARLIEAMADELYINLVGVGSITCRREDLEKGVEPDECYYIKNASRVMKLEGRLDLDRTPPPDLAVEVDVTSRSIDKQPLYAALGVPELWRCKKQTVTFFHLARGGKYRVRERSLSFPFLSSHDFSRFIAMWGKSEDRKIVRSFREFVRDAGGSR